MCRVDFLLTFHERRTADEAIGATESSGFTIVDRSGIDRGFLTVRKNLKLRTYHLARMTSQLMRIVEPGDGYVVLIGPAVLSRPEARTEPRSVELGLRAS
jgi:hypothetical protein